MNAITVQRDENNEISVKRKHLGTNESCELISNGTEIGMLNKVSNGLPEVPSGKGHMSDSCEKNKLEIKNSEATSPISVNEWSRGLHPIEKAVQPVTILKPKVAGEQEVSDGTVINIENLEDKKEPNGVNHNQRKITPFDFFCRKHRLEVASLHPDFNNHQIAKILTEKWCQLSIEEKAIYNNMISKDHPKNITNEENLGKAVKENLNNSKDKSTNFRRVVRKMKSKTKESNIMFDIELIKTPTSLSSSSVAEVDEDLNVMSCLTPGVWICSQQYKLYLLNCFRLQETIVFQRLLETYQFEPESLDSPFILTSNSLGDEAMNVLSQMNFTIGYGNECIISDEKLTANGFKVRLIKGENENHFEVIGMTQNVAFYGVPDLKEILHIVHKKGHSVNLDNCRPGKIILYLQGEAVRIARQYPASKKLEDIEDLLNKRKLLSSNVCIHSKPILQELYSIPAE